MTTKASRTRSEGRAARPDARAARSAGRTARPDAHAAPSDGRAARWAGQQERRRREFVDAAMRAIAEHGPDVSTGQIAAEAGVARTRIYKHFVDAADLQGAIAERALEQVTTD